MFYFRPRRRRFRRRRFGFGYPIYRPYVVPYPVYSGYPGPFARGSSAWPGGPYIGEVEEPSLDRESEQDVGSIPWGRWRGRRPSSCRGAFTGIGGFSSFVFSSQDTGFRNDSGGF
jgi:hypothetical protein